MAITDKFGRIHNYLRISLTDKCNLRCSYCMPEQGVQLSPRSHYMTANEVIEIASTFVRLGVNKIRLTGGEPLVRKDIGEIFNGLATLKIPISITTNGVLVHRHINHLKEAGIETINMSLDTLNAKTHLKISKRDNFNQVFSNIKLLLCHGFKLKINVVIIRGVNDHEIIDFVELTKDHKISVRFIEFMPFKDNNWSVKSTVNMFEILEKLNFRYLKYGIEKITDDKNDTTKNYKIADYKGSFGIISTVSNPFCSTCNRLRLTADGKLRNCLFSNSETDLLNPLREGIPIESIIIKSVLSKKAIRNGMESLESFSNSKLNQENRSMIRIGG